MDTDEVDDHVVALRKMAQMSIVRNKQKREALLQQANALLACFGDAVNKKNKKNKIEDEEEHEAGLAELPVDTHATTCQFPRLSLNLKEKDGTG